MAETSNCEILGVGGTVGNHKILWSVSHGIFYFCGGWKWGKYNPVI